MCGILGIVAQSPVNQLLYDGLLLLQHRGQDAAGIVTAEHNMFHMHKAPGMGATSSARATCAIWAATWASRIAAIPPPDRRSRPPKRSRSTSTRPSASCLATTAT